MYLTEFQKRAIERTFAEGVTLAKVIGADQLDKDYCDDRLHVIELHEALLSRSDDPYVEKELEYDDEELWKELLKQDDVEERCIEDCTFFFIDVYNGFINETWRTWYCAWYEADDKE